MRSIIHTQQQLRAELNQLGYDDLIQKFMQNWYDPSVVFSEIIYRALARASCS